MHIASKCPAKLMAVLTPSKKPNPFIIEGTIQEKKFGQLILDSGADATVISEMAVPSHCLTGRGAEGRGFGQNTTFCEITRVDLELESRRTTVNALVAPNNTLPGIALLGRDIPFLADLSRMLLTDKTLQRQKYMQYRQEHKERKKVSRRKKTRNYLRNREPSQPHLPTLLVSGYLQRRNIIIKKWSRKNQAL